MFGDRHSYSHMQVIPPNLHYALLMTPKRLQAFESYNWHAARHWSAFFQRRVVAGVTIADGIEQQAGTFVLDSIDLRYLLAVAERQHLAERLAIFCSNMKTALNYQLGAACVEYLKKLRPFTLKQTSVDILSVNVYHKTRYQNEKDL